MTANLMEPDLRNAEPSGFYWLMRVYHRDVFETEFAVRIAESSGL